MRRGGEEVILLLYTNYMLPMVSVEPIEGLLRPPDLFLAVQRPVLPFRRIESKILRPVRRFGHFGTRFGPNGFRGHFTLI